MCFSTMYLKNCCGEQLKELRIFLYFWYHDLNKRVERQTLLIQHFWRRWKTEYLTSLREFHRTTGKIEQTIQKGISCKFRPRTNWKLGLVKELVRGKDGLVRSVRIKTHTGEPTRPIVKLYPLEIPQRVHQMPGENLQDVTRNSEWDEKRVWKPETISDDGLNNSNSLDSDDDSLKNVNNGLYVSVILQRLLMIESVKISETLMDLIQFFYYTTRKTFLYCC